MFAKVSNVTEIARDILSSVKVHGPRVAEAFDVKLVSFLGEGRTITGTADVQEAVANWIEFEVVKTEEAEQVLLDELDSLKKVRERRLDEKSALYTKVLGVRGTFEGVVGKGESSKQVGLDAGLAQVAGPVLRRHAKRALAKLEDPEFKPVPKVAGTKIDPRETADDLRPALLRFEDTLEELATQRRITQEAQRVKNDTLDRLHFLTVNGSRMFESFYNLVDERYHAERLRTSRGRSTTRKKLPEGEEPPAEAQADAATAQPDSASADAATAQPDSASEEVSD